MKANNKQKKQPIKEAATNLNTFELLEELTTRSKEEIDFVLLSLMIKGKIDFLSLIQAYVKTLERIRNDKSDLLQEAGCCIIDTLIHYDKRVLNKSGAKDAAQRGLYFLNESNRFNMQILNDRFGYNKEKAKKLSLYERNKKDNN